ncbi:MFS transporter [Amycolatopsis rifamycinica]|uniref:Major facilitator transporter n=1 Tax=Amycolatopsis rifamycinica TaxID=287986 RepID=A0A066UCU9_9PSEU|nr:MFS transporter [Amycolatopsis rifamycinica]KDN22058.1 major facilitator transporter [Amycolatopsis rifamycinica]
MTASTETSTWAPLRRGAFRALWIASFVSNIGSWMQTVGAQWLLVDEHGSPLVISLVQSASSLPVLLLTLPAGVVAEFADRRRLLIGTQAFQVATGAALAVLTVTGTTTPVLLLVFTFLLGCGSAAQLPAYQAFVPDLVPRGELAQAAALSSVGVNLARAAGPAIAGLLVTRLGVGGLFALNAVTFVVFALVLLRSPSPARAPAARQAFLAGIEAGGRYVRHAPVVRRILLRLVVFAVPANVLWALLAPLAHDRLGLGATGYGLLLGAAGIGSVGGALVLPRLRRRLSASWLVAGAGLVFGVAMVVVGTVRSPALVLAVLVPTGAAWIAVIAGMNAATQAFLPGWVRARALSIYQLVLFTSFAGSAALWGVVSSALGLATTFVVAGVLLLAGAATVPRWPLLDVATTGRETVSYWPDPGVTPAPDVETAPVLVSLRYRVRPEERAGFVTAMADLRNTRLRTGGTGWALYRDARDEAVHVEQYTVASWDEHRRQHEQRLTGLDQRVQERVEQHTDGAAEVAHLFRLHPVKKAEEPT